MYANFETVGYVYILASSVAGTLYIGVTSDLITRIGEHRQKIIPGFTKKYDVRMLVHYETYGSVELAITREKKLKRWRREWKIQLIEKLEQFPNRLTQYWGVMPAQAGIHLIEMKMDSRQPLRGFGNDADSIYSRNALNPKWDDLYPKLA